MMCVSSLHAVFEATVHKLQFIGSGVAADENGPVLLLGLVKIFLNSVPKIRYDGQAIYVQLSVNVCQNIKMNKCIVCWLRFSITSCHHQYI